MGAEESVDLSDVIDKIITAHNLDQSPSKDSNMKGQSEPEQLSAILRPSSGDTWAVCTAVPGPVLAEKLKGISGVRAVALPGSHACLFESSKGHVCTKEMDISRASLTS